MEQNDLVKAQGSTKYRKLGHHLGVIGSNLALIFFAIFALFPIIWMVTCTFKSDAEMYNTVFRFTPTLSNYQEVLIGTDYFKAFLQNLVVAGGAVLLTVVAGVPAAYGLARYNFKNKEDIAFTILSFYFGLIWVYQLITMPLLIWVVRGYFEDVSVEIEQAAQLDGYRWYEIFFKILVPLVKPGLVSSALLAFIYAWNSFTFPLILTGFNVQTITITSLRYIASDSVHYGQVAVAATVAILPEIIACLFIQKHLVRGLSFGAVKG